MQLTLFVNRLYKFLELYLSNHFGKLLLVYWILIFILTSIPSRSLPSLGTSDKIKHFGAYFILIFLFRFYLFFNKKFSEDQKQQIRFPIILTILYSVFDELHQILIPGRFFDYFDLVANFMGIFLGMLTANLIISSSSKKNG